MQPSRPTLLIVDDDPSIQTLMRFILQTAFTVHTAADGAIALQIARSLPIDGVVLDLNLPGVSGWDVARTLQQEAPQLPILVVTGRYNRPEEVLQNVAGSTAALIKPFDPLDLITEVQGMLAAHPPSWRGPGRLMAVHAGALAGGADGQRR
ncbi:MAG: response regulator [Herpetosiphonaceae bacterium]|nr:response regulator [Herpetosiphonaceae bacterium]